MRTVLSLVSILALLLATGCPRPPDPSAPPEYDGPGSEAWGSEDITCDTEAECLEGEICSGGICQPDRCSSGLAVSSAPIGETLTFFEENEVAIADNAMYEGAYYLDGYGPSANTLGYDGSWDLGGGDVLDVDGGNLTGARPEKYVVAVSGHRSVGILNGDSVTWKDLDFYPIGIATGDADGDGLDEVVAISSGGEVAVCDVGFWGCDYYEFGGGSEMIDVACGDIDGDSIEEPVLLLDYDGYRYLYAINPDHEENGQPENYQAGVDGGHARLDSGDVDGDYVAELVVLLDGGWFGWWDDSLAVYEAQDTGDGGNFVEAFSYEVDGYAGIVDVAVADTDMNDKAEVLVVDDEANAILLRTTSMSFTPVLSTILDVTVEPKRVAMADHDGDAPRAELVEGPLPCQGSVMPVNIMIMPPYHADHAAGFPSSVMYGDVESQSESMRDTISLGLHVDIGAGGSLFDLFGGEISTKMSTRVSHSITTQTSMFVGARYTMRAYPDVYGPYYAGVVLSWGCFDGYKYKVDDPGHHIGGGAANAEFVMVVPTGGSTSLWSTSRYNALARELGDMPIIEIPYAVGTVDSYPTEPETILGTPIADRDNLFPHPDSYTVSDVGEIVWWMGVEESVTNDIAMEYGMGASANIKVGGVKVGGGADIGWGQAYSLRTGTQATFAGSIPTLRDDPDTPEDEYNIYQYAVQPYVYLQRYTNADGEDAAFYVQTYTRYP